MLVLQKPENINPKNVLLCEKVINTIIQNSYFYRINYSTEDYSTNGIFVYLELKNVKPKIFYNKIKYDFSIKENKPNLQKIVDLEKNILSCFEYLNKNKKYSIREQIDQGNFKIFNDKILKNNFILKMSGIWENETEYGLTYKFIGISHQL